MNIRTAIARAGILAALATIGAGCTSPPPTGVVRAGAHPSFDEAALRASARDFWEVKEQPPLHRALPNPRVAVVEFSIQFAPPDPTMDIAAGIRLELPGLLYGSFVDILREQGQIVKPLDEVNAALIAQGAKGTRFADIQLASGSGDSARWFPVDGLLVLDDQDPALEKSMADVLRDLGADYALQARLRMGARSGALTIEPGSTLKFFSSRGNTLLVSRKALPSEAKAGSGAAMHSREFAIRAHDLFHACVDMALFAAGGAD